MSRVSWLADRPAHKTAGGFVQNDSGSTVLGWGRISCDCKQLVMGQTGDHTVGSGQAVMLITSGAYPDTPEPDVWPWAARFWILWAQVFGCITDLMAPTSLAFLLERNGLTKVPGSVVGVRYISILVPSLYHWTCCLRIANSSFSCSFQFQMLH